MSSSDSDSSSNDDNVRQNADEPEDAEDSSASEEDESDANNDQEQSDDERANIRSELSTMSFEDLMKLKEKLGTKVYNTAVFGESSKPQREVKKEFKRDNKNRPREMGAKRPVPFLGKDQFKKAEKVGPRDPRFDPNCGEFDAKKFKDNFSFVSEIKEKELVELRERLQTATDPKEIKKIKYLIQRMQNQNLEDKKRKEREEVVAEEKQIIKKAKTELRQPIYVTDGERKAKELIKQYLELKTSGKLNKHLEKRRKKNAAKDRKKFSFD